MDEEKRLIEIAEGIWLAEGEIVSFYGFAYPTRSVIVRLDDGGLWVWSPIGLDPPLRTELDALGPVAHLISPNKLHHLFLPDWLDIYPDALLWGPASSIAKRLDLTFQAALGDEAPAAWQGEIDQVWLRGSPLLDEIEFFHRASRTALITDLSQNFNDKFLAEHWSWWQRPIARLWKITKGWGFAPLEVRVTFRDRKTGRDAVRRMLAWRPERVILAHGDPVESGGEAYLARAFSWLEP